MNIASLFWFGFEFAIYHKIPNLVKGPFRNFFLGGAYTWTNICILEMLRFFKQLWFFEIFSSQHVFITDFFTFLLLINKCTYICQHPIV